MQSMVWNCCQTRRLLWSTIININKHRQTFISRIQLTLHRSVFQVSMQQLSQIIRLLNHNACSHHQQATAMKLDGEQIRDLGLTTNSSHQIPSVNVKRKEIKVVTCNATYQICSNELFVVCNAPRQIMFTNAKMGIFLTKFCVHLTW